MRRLIENYVVQVFVLLPLFWISYLPEKWRHFLAVHPVIPVAAMFCLISFGIFAWARLVFSALGQSFLACTALAAACVVLYLLYLLQTVKKLLSFAKTDSN